MTNEPQEELFTLGEPPLPPEPGAVLVFRTDEYRQGLHFGAGLILDQIPLLLSQVAELPVDRQLDTVRRWAEQLRRRYE